MANERRPAGRGPSQPSRGPSPSNRGPSPSGRGPAQHQSDPSQHHARNRVRRKRGAAAKIAGAFLYVLLVIAGSAALSTVGWVWACDLLGLNKELVSFEDVSNKYDVLELKEMIQEHVAYTNSARGKEILEHFGEYLPKFKKILPHDYRRMMNSIVQMEEKGLSSEQAQIEAFYVNKQG